MAPGVGVRRTRNGLAVLVVVVALVGAACSSGGTTTADRSATPAYARKGPYPVGYTTLALADRKVSVWYPARRNAVTRAAKASYDQRTPLPDDLKGLVPDQYNTVVAMDAYADVRGSDKGPFPVLLFSHGFGGYRLVNSALMTGIASWGFVVVAADYRERGIEAQIRGQRTVPDPTRDPRLMLATLDLVAGENRRPDSVLEGVVDARRVGSAGHSAGGGTAFDALRDPRVKVAIGWAPVGPSLDPAAKPTMIIGALGDVALTPEQLRKEYASFPPPRRFVEIGGAGHNSFTDSCPVIRQGGGLIEFARQRKLVAESLLKLGENGCEAGSIDPEKVWSVVQHFTVAELRAVFGVDKRPVGLGSGVARAFPGVRVTYLQQP